MSTCLEIIRFRVTPASAPDFVQQRAAVDLALTGFEDFLGSELAEGPGDDWTLLVRWAGRSQVEAAQAVTLTAPGLPALAAWTQLAAEFLSFQTAELRHSFSTAPRLSGDSSCPPLL
jgi:hypothetical protein